MSEPTVERSSDMELQQLSTDHNISPDSPDNVEVANESRMSPYPNKQDDESSDDKDAGANNACSPKRVSKSDISNWSEDELFQWIEDNNINADSVESLSEMRMLVTSHYDGLRDHLPRDALHDRDVTPNACRPKRVSKSDISNWSEDELFQWIEDNNINADSVESLSEMRMLVTSHYDRLREDLSRDALHDRDVTPYACRPKRVSKSDISNWSEDELFQWIEDNNINAESVESLSEMRMLVTSHYDGQREHLSRDALHDRGVTPNACRPKRVSKSDISNWSKDELIQWIEDYNINADSVESLSEMRMLVTSHYDGQRDNLSRDALHDRDVTPNCQQVIADIIADDNENRLALVDIYKGIKGFIGEHGKETKLEDIYPEHDNDIDSYIKDLGDKECPIFVAGEVSAGKSSLLNLLLGEDIFPTAHLACSSTIARLHNSTRMALEVTFEHDRRTFENLKDVRELQEHMRKYSVHNREEDELPCKQIDIYWPVPMLPVNVVLVDVPGFGESTKMNKWVLACLERALVCIYVLFSANAGGIQQDTLTMIIQDKIRTTNPFACEYAFDNTLFVCNYWDMVKASEQEDEVWKNTIEKLKSLIPNLDSSKVVKMSVKEASRYMRMCLGKTPMFETLMNQFHFLTKDALTVKTRHHNRIQKGLLMQIYRFLTERENLESMTQEEKQRKIEETRRAVDVIDEESKQISKKTRELVDKEYRKVSEHLYNHLHEQATKERFLNCKDETKPILALKEELTKLLERRILNKLQAIISEWEEEHHMFADLQKTVLVDVEEYLSKTSETLRSIDLTLTNGLNEGSFDLVSENTQNTHSLLPNVKTSTRSRKVTSSKWALLAMAEGIIEETIQLAADKIRTLVSGLYSNTDFQHMMSHRIECILEHLSTRRNVERYLYANYFESMIEHVNVIIDEHSKEQIAVRRRELTAIETDHRSSDQVCHCIEKAKTRLDRLMECFSHYTTKYATNEYQGGDEQVPDVSGATASANSAQ